MELDQDLVKLVLRYVVGDVKKVFVPDQSDPEGSFPPKCLGLLDDSLGGRIVRMHLLESVDGKLIPKEPLCVLYAREVLVAINDYHLFHVAPKLRFSCFITCLVDFVNSVVIHSISLVLKRRRFIMLTKWEKVGNL